jgi:chitinase
MYRSTVVWALALGLLAGCGADPGTSTLTNGQTGAPSACGAACAASGGGNANANGNAGGNANAGGNGNANGSGDANANGGTNDGSGANGGAGHADAGAGNSGCGAHCTTGGALPKHALIGYWHDFANPSGPAFRLAQVSSDWDVIVVAFASNAQPSGSMAFALDPSLDAAQFKADVAAKRAAGKKVVLSLGGQDGTVSLNSSSDVDNFVSSLTGIIKDYGFDGLDIDLETGAGITMGAAVQTNLVTGIQRIKAATLGPSFYLSMAPEHPYVQGGYVAYAGIWGSYLPIIDALRDDLTVLHVQLYNDGGMPTAWGTFQPTTEDLLVASSEMLLAGFQTAGGPFFKPLRPDQIAFGVPSGQASSNPGNFVPVDAIEAAFTCLTTGKSCATHTPSATWPALRGVMTWSINWDAHDGAASFSQPLAAFLHGQQ